MAVARPAAGVLDDSCPGGSVVVEAHNAGRLFLLATHPVIW